MPCLNYIATLAKHSPWLCTLFPVELYSNGCLVCYRNQARFKSGKIRVRSLIHLVARIKIGFNIAEEKYRWATWVCTICGIYLYLMFCYHQWCRLFRQEYLEGSLFGYWNYLTGIYPEVGSMLLLFSIPAWIFCCLPWSDWSALFETSIIP